LKLFGEVLLGSSPLPIDDLLSWSGTSGKTTRRGEGEDEVDDGMESAGRGGAKWAEGESNRTPRSKNEEDEEEDDEEDDEGEGGVRR
jgi:hypothetical protein